MFSIKVKVKVKVKVKDKGLNLRVKVISLFYIIRESINSQRRYIIEVRRLKDYTKKTINNDNNKEILNQLRKEL